MQNQNQTLSLKNCSNQRGLKFRLRIEWTVKLASIDALDSSCHSDARKVTSSLGKLVCAKQVQTWIAERGHSHPVYNSYEGRLARPDPQSQLDLLV